MAINPGVFVKRIKLKDKEWQRVRNEFKKLDDAVTAVGWFGEEQYMEGMTVASVAAVQEFGSSDGKIPERSFMRAWVDSNKAKIESVKLKLLRLMIDGTIDAKTALKRLGVWATGEIQKYITDLTSPPNAPSTILKKGSSSPLIDTGVMRNSMDNKEFYGKGSWPK